MKIDFFAFDLSPISFLFSVTEKREKSCICQNRTKQRDLKDTQSDGFQNVQERDLQVKCLSSCEKRRQAHDRAENSVNGGKEQGKPNVEHIEKERHHDRKNADHFNIRRQEFV